MPLQAFPSLQLSGVPGWHPLPGSQVSVPLQTFPSSQLSGVPAQAPLEQESFPVQAFPSSQEALLLVWVQPVPGSQPSSVQTL
jgi:hypothetical protein